MKKNEAGPRGKRSGTRRDVFSVLYSVVIEGLFGKEVILRET